MTLAALAPEGGFRHRPLSVVLRRLLLVVIAACALVVSALMVHTVGTDSGTRTGSVASVVVDESLGAPIDDSALLAAACGAECDPMIAVAVVCWMVTILVLTIIVARPPWLARSALTVVTSAARAPSGNVRRFAPSIHALSIDRQ